jgi:hypothetical protein
MFPDRNEAVLSAVHYCFCMKSNSFVDKYSFVSTGIFYGSLNLKVHRGGVAFAISSVLHTFGTLN